MRKQKDIKIGDYTLEEILEKHLHWLNRDCENWESMRADLHEADMSYADMRGVDMSGANMRGANISYANMSYANMSYAKVRSANMRDANMCYANMRSVDMIGVDLNNANMCCAKVRSVDRLRKGIKLSEPIIGWKKCKNDVLVKLEIPRGAIIFSINNNKCRTDKAKVLEIIGGDRAYSNYKFFSYYVGDVIEIFDFNCEYNVECAKGIHFFKTREEAENY